MVSSNLLIRPDVSGGGHLVSFCQSRLPGPIYWSHLLLVANDIRFPCSVPGVIRYVGIRFVSVAFLLLSVASVLMLIGRHWRLSASGPPVVRGILYTDFEK